MPRFFYRKAFIVLMTTLFAVSSLHFVIPQGRDNQNCSIHYQGLEESWLKASKKKRVKVDKRDIDDKFVMNFVDTLCHLEAVALEVRKGKGSILEFHSAQLAHVEAYIPVSEYMPYHPHYRVPDLKTLALWIILTNVPKNKAYDITLVFKRERESTRVSLRTNTQIHRFIYGYGLTQKPWRESFVIRRKCENDLTIYEWIEKCELTSITQYQWHQHHYVTRDFNQYGLITSIQDTSEFDYHSTIY